MLQEESLRAANAIYQRLLCPQHGIAGDLAGHAFDLAIQLRDDDTKAAQSDLDSLGHQLGHLGWIGVSLGFTQILSTAMEPRRAELLQHVLDEIPHELRSSWSGREAWNLSVGHGGRHCDKWFHHYDTEPVHAIAYWLEVPQSHYDLTHSMCHQHLISVLGLMAARHLREPIAL